ncbi:MAG: hypothetical protein ACUVT3_00690 [Ignavibacterium sp.]
MEITFPSDTVEIIDKIRAAIGREVIFTVVSGRTECPTCGVNPVTGVAIDPFCPTCSGSGYLYNYAYIPISGHVTWGHNDLPEWVTAGKYFTGDCIVQIKFTPEILELLNRTVYVTVDDIKTTIRGKILRGVPKINRVILDLKQEE